MIINKQYIAGVLDTNGGFYMYRKKYIYYKVTIKQQKILHFIQQYLKGKMGIDMREYNGIFYVTKKDSVDKLINFITVNCLRQDYKLNEVK